LEVRQGNQGPVLVETYLKNWSTKNPMKYPRKIEIYHNGKLSEKYELKVKGG